MSQSPRVTTNDVARVTDVQTIQNAGAPDLSRFSTDFLEGRPQQ
jgi:hypothetical protein